MAAFVPIDDSTSASSSPFRGGGGRIPDSEANFLRTAEELRALPADLITPLPAYSLYQEQEAVHHLSLPAKPRSSPFESFATQPSQALPPPPSSSSGSSWLLYGPSSSLPFPPASSSLSSYSLSTPVDSGLSTLPPRGPQSSSFSTPPFGIYSPGLHLNVLPNSTTGYDFSRSYFPLTPPVDDANAAKPSSYPFEFGGDESCLLPVFPSLLSSSSYLTNDSHSFTVSATFDPSTSTCPPPLSPISATSQPRQGLPFSSQSSSSLTSLISSGLARRRSRLPASLPSPSLSASSARSQPLKPRTSHGGARSQYSRDEVVTSCTTCQIELATLQLRKKGESLDVDFVCDFTCFECSPELAGGEEPGLEMEEPQVGYCSSLSALLDREEGLEAPRKRRRIGSKTKARRATVSRRDVADNSLACDVCRRIVASGEIRPKDSREKLNFTVEVICSHCSSTYRRCSDDGGGGGRLGVGKWRCKELFEEGRKNCSFSHARMGPIQDLIYDTHSVTGSDLAGLESACFDFFRNSVLSALAVPDVLEGEDSIAASYEQIEKMAVDSWAHFETFFRASPDPTKKRFVGLRWANPTTRKKGRKNPSSPLLSATGDSNGGGALRSGLRLTGFAITEVDIENGILFTPLTMPIGSVGETYDASTTLLQHLSRHIASDLEMLNLERRRNRLPSFPLIEEAWTAVLFSKDTRGANHLETRRGYLPLEKHFAMHGTTSELHIRSRLDEFLPPCLQGGWRLFARPYSGYSDDWGQLVSNRRRRKSVSSTSDNPRNAKYENEDSDADYEELPSTKRTKRSRL